MRFLGLHLPSFTFPGVDSAELFPRLVEIAAAAERSGFTALSVMDHYHQIAPQGEPDEPMLEAYTTLGALAARTERLQLLTLVTGVIYHNPAQLAKTVTTLDVISGGRAILGIGAAWNDEESRAYGFEFPPIGERMDRLEEAVRICRSMLDSPTTTFEGRRYRVEGAHNVPRPLRDRVPILIGGNGERRTLRLVARHADLCNIIGTGDAATVRQVFENQESTKRQYALRQRAVALGWPIERVIVIDSDLGQSGSSSTDREGFQRLVAELYKQDPPLLRADRRADR